MARWRMKVTILLISCVIVTGSLLGLVSPIRAEWSGEVKSYLYGTDDAALFSATRRLSLGQDPTQPALDDAVFGVGADMVYEPDFQVNNEFETQWGRTELNARTQGFIFAIHPEFNHGSLGLRAKQHFTPNTAFMLRYFFGPNLLLGENEAKRSETEELAEERVTTHFLSAVFEQQLAEHWKGRILGRYGVRLYNEAFSQRDTQFWTIGPHVDWQITHRVELTLGYHYEVGVADGRNEPQFQDDVGYINHFFSGELGVELTERWEMEFGLHYERNNWTSDLPGDVRNGEHEDVFQGDFILIYALSDAAHMRAGVQRQHRKESFEEHPVTGTNVWVGAQLEF